MPSQLTHISLIYRLYFLYWEPFSALAGTYLAFFDPQRLLRGTVPLPAYEHFANPATQTLDISPVLQMALTNIGSLYALFAVNEGIVLRLTRDRRIWCTVILGMVCSDVGHIYAAWKVWPERLALGEVLKWNSDEWINYGTLFAGLGLRILFLLGFGRR
ncbi:uncharacterized protein L3040_006779 [Drepanopeziza brunnea f. sp. 'multigermtubi']|nr:hypothetical protein L3040_006779 [Drepanopeziza brunnea f. sp. 'multigermtubi']